MRRFIYSKRARIEKLPKAKRGILLYYQAATVPTLNAIALSIIVGATLFVLAESIYVFFLMDTSRVYKSSIERKAVNLENR